MLAEGKLNMGHARALLALPALKQIDLARDAATRGLSVREVEHRVAAALANRSGPRVRPALDRDVARLQENLAQQLGTRVQIRAKRKGRGTLVIDYGSLDELDRLIQRLSR